MQSRTSMSMHIFNETTKASYKNEYIFINTTSQVTKKMFL